VNVACIASQQTNMKCHFPVFLLSTIYHSELSRPYKQLCKRHMPFKTEGRVFVGITQYKNLSIATESHSAHTKPFFKVSYNPMALNHTNMHAKWFANIVSSL